MVKQLSLYVAEMVPKPSVFEKNGMLLRRAEYWQVPREDEANQCAIVE